MTLSVITDAEFTGVTGGVAAVLFTAAWCVPSRRIVAELVAVSPVAGVAVHAADTAVATESASRAGVNHVPCLVLYRGGQEIARSIGFWPRATLQNWFEEQLRDRAA